MALHINNIVMLPGMDGSGILFKPFLSCKPADISVSVIPLPDNTTYDFPDYAAHISQQLPQHPFILIAESFSGRIAYELATHYALPISHVVFAASFISKPNSLLTLAKNMPLALIKNKLMLNRSLARLFFGFDSPATIRDLYHSLNTMDDKLLRRRLTLMDSLGKPDRVLETPCTYIRPSRDLLVSKAARLTLRESCKLLDYRVIQGTHFALQSNPQACWSAIDALRIAH